MEIIQIILQIIGPIGGYFIVLYLSYWILDITEESKFGKIVAMILLIGYVPIWILGILLYTKRYDQIQQIFAFIFLILLIYCIFYFYQKKEFESFFIRQLNKVFQKIMDKINNNSIDVLDEQIYPFLATVGLMMLSGCVFFIIDTFTDILVSFLSLLFNYWFYCLSVILVVFSMSILLKKSSIKIKIIFVLLTIITIYSFYDYRNETKIQFEYKSILSKYLVSKSYDQ